MTTPPCPPLAPVIGHRGAAAHAPENTLASLALAADLGARWVEVDVRLSADQVPMLLHDETLDRTSDGRGLLSAWPASALAKLDAGSWFSPRFAGARVPTLAQTLALCRDRGLAIVLELKPDSGRAPELLRQVALALDHAAPTACLLSSSEPVVLEAARDALPHVPRAMVLDEPPHWPLVDALGCCSVHCWERWLHGAALAAALAAGVLAAYTVNDAARALQLFDAGVTSVFSDRPDVILAALAGRERR